MKYYKVRPHQDHTLRPDGQVLLAGELYTPKEAEKYGLDTFEMELIEIPRKFTHMWFGSRFEINPSKDLCL